jgi:hypothetical protein
LCHLLYAGTFAHCSNLLVILTLAFSSKTMPGASKLQSNRTNRSGSKLSRLCFPFFVVVKVEDFKRTPNVCRNAKAFPQTNIQQRRAMLQQGILKGEVSLYC